MDINPSTHQMSTGRGVSSSSNTVGAARADTMRDNSVNGSTCILVSCCCKEGGSNWLLLKKKKKKKKKKQAAAESRDG
jgi:glutamate 5-kinase